MKTLLRLKCVARAVQVALAQCVVLAAHADSGVGVDSVLGNAMSSSPRRAPQLPKDPDGMGLTLAPRSPTGFMNVQPRPPGMKAPLGDDWLYSASVEVGLLAGDGNTKAAYFRMYKDVDNGFLLNNLQLSAEKPNSALFLEAQAGGVGRRDQFYGLQFGRYNDWKVKLFYNETSHVFTDTFKSFWNGIGTDTLTLPAGIPAAAGAVCTNPPTCTTFTSAAYGLTTPTAQAAVNVAAARALDSAVRAAGNTEISLKREKGGARLDMFLTDRWKVYASGTLEKRKGARPFGATWAAGGGAGNIETVESIDYDTHDLAVGTEYSDELSSFNLQVNGSFFRNNIDTQTFQNPYLPATANGINGALFTGGRYDLYPDNDFYNVKAEYARRFPSLFNGRFTGVLSRSSLRQNDRLIPSTSIAGVNAGVAGGNWDSTASLSRQQANARIDTSLADLSLTLNPLSGLDVRGKFRYYETDNSNDYTACNPLNGQYGRLVNDGTGQALVSFTNNNGTALSTTQLTALNAFMAANACNVQAMQNYVAGNNLAPNAGNSQIRSVPYEYKQINYGATADYRIGRNRNVNLALEREDFQRRFRERDRTWEYKGKLTYVDRSLEGGTVRLSAEQDRRRGSAYDPDPTETSFYSFAFGIPTAPGSTAALTNWIHNIDQFRKFDLADRDQSILNARFNYALRSDLDGGITLQLKDAKFPSSQFGRNGHQRQNSVNVDLNWAPSTELNVYGYYARQQAQTHQNSVWPNACSLGSTYYFYSDGSVLARAPGGPVPATPPGTTLVNTQAVTPDNYYGSCAVSSATSPLYPTSRTWGVSQKDRNDVVGIGASYDFGRPKLSVDYVYTRGRTSIAYAYNPAAVGLTATQAAVAGGGWPDMRFTQNVVNTSVLMPLTKTMALRFLWSYEQGRIDDWHYDGVAANPTGGAGTGYNVNMLYLDTGPKNYRANVFGAFLRVEL